MYMMKPLHLPPLTSLLSFLSLATVQTEQFSFDVSFNFYCERFLALAGSTQGLGNSSQRQFAVTAEVQSEVCTCTVRTDFSVHSVSSFDLSVNLATPYTTRYLLNAATIHSRIAHFPPFLYWLSFLFSSCFPFVFPLLPFPSTVLFLLLPCSGSIITNSISLLFIVFSVRA